MSSTKKEETKVRVNCPIPEGKYWTVKKKVKRESRSIGDYVNELIDKDLEEVKNNESE